MSIRDTASLRGAGMIPNMMRRAAGLDNPLWPKKPKKSQRIADLEAANRTLTREASKQRLIVLLVRPFDEGTVVVLDKLADDYTIKADNDIVKHERGSVEDGLVHYEVPSGTITIRWR